jgi:hypothetical protein
MKMKQLENDKYIVKVSLLTSISFYFLSLPLICYCTIECASSFLALAFGWLGVFEGGAGLTWLANPLLWFCWIGRKNLNMSFYLSLFSTLISLSFMLFPTIMHNEAGHYSEITEYGLGYWLWVLSSLIMLSGNTLRLKLYKRLHN